MSTAILFSLATLVGADAKGWDALFPTLDNFDRKVAAPKVEKGEKPTTYSQSVTYEWMGGRFEVLTITLSRDPKFKEQYAAEAMKKEKPAPEVIEVNKKPAYMWDRQKADDLEKVNKRLVVVLADDKILTVEQRGFGLDLAEVAKKLDFEKVVKALENPPPAKKE